MKGLKIIPLFLVLIVLAYVGMLFVEANRDSVTIQFGNWQAPPTALGFVVLTSALVGMMISGVLCMVELLALIVQNRRLKRKLASAKVQLAAAKERTQPLATVPSLVDAVGNELDTGRKVGF